MPFFSSRAGLTFFQSLNVYQSETSIHNLRIKGLCEFSEGYVGASSADVSCILN